MSHPPSRIKPHKTPHIGSIGNELNDLNKNTVCTKTNAQTDSHGLCDSCVYAENKNKILIL